MKRSVGTVVAALLAAATVGSGWLAPAQASGSFCSGGGVNVVVDFHQLGGGIAKACDVTGGGQHARAIFTAAGFSVTDAPTQPGFVCHVDGKPKTGSCQGTASYWGLFWARKGTTSWTYSSLGVDGLTVPAGASVAFSWQDSSTKAPPGVEPPKPPKSPPPPPTPSKSPKPTRHPHPSKSSSPSESASPVSNSSASAKPSRAAPPSRTPRPQASASPGASATPLVGAAAPGPRAHTGLEPAAAHPGGGPGNTLWLSLGLIVLMIGTAAVLVTRSRR